MKHFFAGIRATSERCYFSLPSILNSALLGHTGIPGLCAALRLPVFLRPDSVFEQI